MNNLRTGNCFESAFNYMTNPANYHKDMRLCHGLPIGQGGFAAKVGEFPHAWIEIASMGIVHDTEKDITVPMDAYYRVGEIDYVKKYTRMEVFKLVEEHETSGPWDDKIKARDIEIDEIIEASNWS